MRMSRKRRGEEIEKSKDDIEKGLTFQVETKTSGGKEDESMVRSMAQWIVEWLTGWLNGWSTQEMLNIA